MTESSGPGNRTRAAVAGTQSTPTETSLSASLPSADLLNRQAEWLSPARARLLRRVAIARRRRVLDLGAGRGAVTGELARRSGGVVIALDSVIDALRQDPEPFSKALRLCADAARLPFSDGALDLVFCQCALMWMDASVVVSEVWRVLQAGGALVAVEPDYGGMLEHPPTIATRDLWIAALGRAGADALIGRKLPGLLDARGFEVRVDLLPELLAPKLARCELLRGLPLNKAEQKALRRVEEEEASISDTWERVVHLPFCLVTATKRRKRH